MPTDKAGKFHLNAQRAMASDKAATGPSKGITAMPGVSGEETSDGTAADTGVHTTLHNHGDGTFHTEHHDGTRTEHPHIGHALAHMHGLHNDGGAKHINVHSDGMTHTSHQHDGSGNVEGPHDHANIEALKEHMGKFLDEESHEWSGDDYKGGEAAKGY
jgi:hypothetical protein